MKKNIGIFYKKNSCTAISSAVLNMDREIIDVLGISKEDSDIIFFFKDDVICLQKGKTDDEVKIKSKENLEYKKNIKLNFTKVYKDKDYLITRLNIPSAVIKKMGLTDTDNEVDVNFVDDKVIIKRSEKTMGKIFTIKVNKGGIGKTLLTVQLGHGLALQEKKVLLLTSDSQNNILDYTLPEKEQEKIDFKKDLRYCVVNDKFESIKLRKNLYFIPTKSSLFSEKFLQKLPAFLEKMKTEYDYILIDSIPTMKIDTEFVKCADKIIIPMFCDIPTLKGAMNVIQESGVDKIHSIIVNMYRPTATQKEVFAKISEVVEQTDIIFPQPIKELSQIETLARKGKTVWESRAKIITEAQNSLLDVIINL